jgi:hypothetical protein
MGDKVASIIKLYYPTSRFDFEETVNSIELVVITVVMNFGSGLPLAIVIV